VLPVLQADRAETDIQTSNITSNDLLNKFILLSDFLSFHRSSGT
jgi:hypothetical protein